MGRQEEAERDPEDHPPLLEGRTGWGDPRGQVLDPRDGIFEDHEAGNSWPVPLRLRGRGHPRGPSSGEDAVGDSGRGGVGPGLAPPGTWRRSRGRSQSRAGAGMSSQAWPASGPPMTSSAKASTEAIAGSSSDSMGSMIVPLPRWPMTAVSPARRGLRRAIRTPRSTAEGPQEASPGALPEVLMQLPGEGARRRLETPSPERRSRRRGIMRPGFVPLHSVRLGVGACLWL